MQSAAWWETSTSELLLPDQACPSFAVFSVSWELLSSWQVFPVLYAICPAVTSLRRWLWLCTLPSTSDFLHNLLCLYAQAHKWLMVPWCGIRGLEKGMDNDMAKTVFPSCVLHAGLLRVSALASVGNRVVDEIGPFADPIWYSLHSQLEERTRGRSSKVWSHCHHFADKNGYGLRLGTALFLPQKITVWPTAC